MENALWLERHTPSLSAIEQADAREYLQGCVGEKINLLVYGPEGCGKTASVRAWAEETHDDVDNDFMVVNASDFFNRSKKEIRSDDRFGHFLRGQTEFSKQYRNDGSSSNKYKRNWSKRDMLCHVLKEISGYEKSSGGFKTVVIDNASEMRTDFQQALRRIIENNHETTQFIIITRSKSDVIAAIQSRCTPVPLRNPTTDECVNVITTMLEEEDVEYTIDGVEFLVGASEHDIREAVLTAQTVAEQTGELTQQNVFDTCSEIGYEITIDDIVVAADAGELKDARDDLDELLVDEGVSGDEVLHMISETVHNKFTDEKKLELVSAVSETDVLLSEGDNERVHLMKLLGEIASC